MAKIDGIKKEALLNKIPIVRDETLKIITNLIKEKNIKTILEIGSATGYSAISMALENTYVLSIEKDINLYRKAMSNLSLYKELKIDFINADALEYKTNDKFDLLFIDAAKSKYLDFFKNFEKNLNTFGYLVCDNINFGLNDIVEYKKRLHPICKKMKTFISFMKENKNYKISIIKVDDGILIAQKIK